jgi:dephospho-CoA kinase
MVNKVIAIVGMAGAGKSTSSNYFASKGFSVVSFGEIVIEEIKRRGLPCTQQNEQIVREDLRAKHGMSILAEISLPFIRVKLEENQAVVIDNLVSFTEYKILRRELDNELVVLALFSSRNIRYARLHSREFRPLTVEEATNRDEMEIEKIEKGGPIAMADFIIVNDDSKKALFKKIDLFIASLG